MLRMYLVGVGKIQGSSRNALKILVDVIGELGMDYTEMVFCIHTYGSARSATLLPDVMEYFRRYDQVILYTIYIDSVMPVPDEHEPG